MHLFFMPSTYFHFLSSYSISSSFSVSGSAIGLALAAHISVAVDMWQSSSHSSWLQPFIVRKQSCGLGRLWRRQFRSNLQSISWSRSKAKMGYVAVEAGILRRLLTYAWHLPGASGCRTEQLDTYIPSAYMNSLHPGAWIPKVNILGDRELPVSKGLA